MSKKQYAVTLQPYCGELHCFCYSKKKDILFFFITVIWHLSAVHIILLNI